MAWSCLAPTRMQSRWQALAGTHARAKRPMLNGALLVCPWCVFGARASAAGPDYNAQPHIIRTTSSHDVFVKDVNIEKIKQVDTKVSPPPRRNRVQHVSRLPISPFAPLLPTHPPVRRQAWPHTTISILIHHACKSRFISRTVGLLSSAYPCRHTRGRPPDQPARSMSLFLPCPAHGGGPGTN